MQMKRFPFSQAANAAKPQTFPPATVVDHFEHVVAGFCFQIKQLTTGEAVISVHRQENLWDGTLAEPEPQPLPAAKLVNQFEEMAGFGYHLKQFTPDTVVVRLYRPQGPSDGLFTGPMRDDRQTEQRQVYDDGFTDRLPVVRREKDAYGSSPEPFDPELYAWLATFDEVALSNRELVN